MELVPGHVHRALAYVRLLNGRGIDPTRAEVDRFAQTDPPRDAQYESNLQRVLSSVWAYGSTKIRNAEPVVGYLQSMEWVAVSPGSAGHVHLTESGAAVLAGLNEEVAAEPPEPMVVDVVLEPHDPMVYFQLTRLLASAGAGLLVDAYFKADAVSWLVETTTLRRVLVSSRHRTAEADLRLMAGALGTVPNAGNLEVRASDSKELHDRCLIREDGAVQLLGASINGVGRNITSIVTPDAEVGRVYRDRYETLWQSATPVTPQAPPGAASAVSGP